MDDGTPVLFTKEELRKAAETQAGEPLTKDHPADESGNPQYPPPTDETVGKVPKANYVEAHEAVGYEATTHVKEIAQGVQGESYDVSVHPTFELGEKDPETGAYIARNIQFLDLSVVSKGDSPSNTAKWGPNQALASATRSGEITAELTSTGDGADGSSTQGGVREAVRGTLDALGLSFADVQADADGWQPSDGAGHLPTEDGDGGQRGNEGAESSADRGSSTQMDETTREQYVSFLTANAGFDEESVNAMDDDVLERTYELAAEGAASDGGGDGGSTTEDDDDEEKTLAEMTPDEAASELGDALRDQGFITEDNADEVVAQVKEEASKGEKVDAIIAHSDDYDEDDREDLMASADSLVEREHDRVTGQSGVSISGSAGVTASVGAPMPGAADGEADDLDDYDTGVADQ